MVGAEVEEELKILVDISAGWWRIHVENCKTIFLTLKIEIYKNLSITFSSTIIRLQILHFT